MNATTPGALAVLLGAPALHAQLAPPRVIDLFQRPLDDVGVRIVDWEGHIANPALRFFVVPPEGAAYPATVVLRADHARLYFTGNRATIGPDGPRLQRTLRDSSPAPFRLAIYPDREGGHEEHTLTVSFTDATGALAIARLPIHVFDQDRDDRGLDFRITVDFSEDRSGFFDEAVRQLTRQAADDWAYFFADPGYDEVPAGAQGMWIWNWPLAWNGGGGHVVFNSAPYTGFLLYAYGIDTPEKRSGGAPTSGCCLQTVGGLATSLRPTGGIAMEVKGNFNTRGWIVNTDEDLWWVSGNLSGQVPDLYSITLHEMGHALAFETSYGNFFLAKLAGGFDQPRIVDYQRAVVTIDNVPDHLTVVDRVSRRGAFGNGFSGQAPVGRRLPTKVDVLVMEEIGYELRDLASLVPFDVIDTELEDARIGRSYDDRLAAQGGVPFHDWTITTGTLPPGLTLDRFSGRVRGTPSEAGVFPLTVRVRDYDTAGEERTFATTLRVGPPAEAGDAR